MINNFRNGKEILDDFFADLKDDTSLDQSIREMLVNLYKENNFTDTNISNKLSEMRE